MKRHNQYLIGVGLALMILSSAGCSSFWGKDKQFTNPTIGAAEIVHDVFSKDDKQGACRSGTKKEKERCEKEVEELTKKMTKTKDN